MWYRKLFVVFFEVHVHEHVEANVTERAVKVTRKEVRKYLIGRRVVKVLIQGLLCRFIHTSSCNVAR